MATLEELQARERLLQEELQRAGEALRARGDPDDVLATQRTQLRAGLAEIRREIALATNQSAATGIFEGEDNQTGLYRYKNPITGNSFLSGTAPTAEQQTASGVKLVPPDTTPPPNPAPTAAADVAASPAGATQNPASAPATANERLTTTQAATLAATTDTGTNAPVKTLAQTQSVPPANNSSSTEGRPAGAPGVGAGEDGQTASNTQRILNTFNKTRFVPKNNILDQYASYTYNIAWYLMDPASVAALVKTGKPNYASYSLLMQSGGASTAPNAAIARNKFFELDYYIDNLEIKSKITGKGTGRANNATDISFTVTETTGITLIDNLYNAVQGVYKNSDIPYVSAMYCLVIKFYGYDETGKIVQASNGDYNNALVEKIIPFKLSELNFSVGNKLVEYTVKAKPLVYDVGFGSNLGVIKAPIEITGATVKDLLMNGIANADISADDGRISSAQPPAPPVTADTIFTNATYDALGNYTGDSPYQVGA